MKTHIVTLTVPLAAYPENPTNRLSMTLLLPDGIFSARDGRPASITGGSLSDWSLSPAVADRLIKLWQGRATPLVVDYEHQSLNTRQNGQPAPAAGWIESLCYTPGQGLSAGIRWTQSAVSFLRRDEYRYISPVFSFDPQSGEVLELKGAALTNTPALDGLAAVGGEIGGEREMPPGGLGGTVQNGLSRFARKGLGSPRPPQCGLTNGCAIGKAVPEVSGVPCKTNVKMQKEFEMDMLERLRKLFGLSEEAGEKEMIAELEKLDAFLQGDGTVKAEGKSIVERLTKEFVPESLFKKMQKQMELLSKKGSDSVESGIDAALTDGRLTKNLIGWARELGKRDPEALRSYLSVATPIAALTATQTHGRPELFGMAQTLSGLNDEEQFVCDQLGLSEEAYLEQRSGKRR